MTDNIVEQILYYKYFGQHKPINDLRLLFNVLCIRFMTYMYINYYQIKTSTWDIKALFKDLLYAYFIIYMLTLVWSLIRRNGPIGGIKLLFKKLTKMIFAYILMIPPIRNKVNKEIENTRQKIEDSIIVKGNSITHTKIPEQGIDLNSILSELEESQNLKRGEWEQGKVSGTVYHGGDEILSLQLKAYGMNLVSNQLHPDVFPGIRNVESEVVSMVLDLYNAPATGCGTTTSGGTESLLLAGLAAREYGKRHKGITKPEIIAPVTVHAGIEKACFYFGIILNKIELDPITFQVDLKKVKLRINRNTVLLVGSTPNYPHGIMDDIEGLSKLALKYKIPLHVDSCLGSFITPFLSELSDNVPLTDFRVEGVTSISCDTHKYGFAPKGSSIIMYREPSMRECQYYLQTDWTGGLYGSPTLAGSRPGALMAGCWATLLKIGKQGYLDLAKSIVEASMKFKRALIENEKLNQYLEVIGDPIGPVVSFQYKKTLSNKLSIYDLSDNLSKAGWHFSSLQSPAALHFAFTKPSLEHVDDLISNLIKSLNGLTQNIDSSAKKPPGDTAAFYGVAGSIRTTGIADKIIVAYLDTLYKT